MQSLWRTRGGHVPLASESVDRTLHMLGADELAAFLGTSVQDGLSLVTVAQREAELDTVVADRPGQFAECERQARRWARQCSRRSQQLSRAGRARVEAAHFAALLRAATPMSVTLKRDGAWTRLPVASLAFGDVMRVETGGVVPSDAIVVRCSPNAVALPTPCHGSATRTVCAYCTDRSESASRNVLRGGDLLLRGSAECIAVGTCDVAALAAQRDSLRQCRALTSAVLQLEAVRERDMVVPQPPSRRPTALPPLQFCEHLVHSRLLVRGRAETAAFGAANTILCKAEALTEGRLEVRAVVLSMRVYTHEDIAEAAGTSGLFRRVCMGAAAVSQADVANSWLYSTQEDVGGQDYGDFSDAALLRFADRWSALAGVADAPTWLDAPGSDGAPARVAMHPFDAQNPVQVVATRTAAGGIAVRAVGAPSKLLSLCRRYASDDQNGDESPCVASRPAGTPRGPGVDGECPLHPGAMSRIEGLVRYLECHHGLSVVAVTEGSFPEQPPDLGRWTLLSPPQGMTLVGLLGLRDPPREGASGWLQMLRMMGLDVRLLSDGPAPAALQLAKSIGLRESLQDDDCDLGGVSPPLSPSSYQQRQQQQLEASQDRAADLDSDSPSVDPLIQEQPSPVVRRKRTSSNQRLISGPTDDDEVLSRAVFVAQTAADKVRVVSSLQRLGKRVLLLAGSTTDVPAVLAADASTATKQAPDVVCDACDSVLTEDGLQSLVDTLQLTRSELIIRSDQPTGCGLCAIS